MKIRLPLIFFLLVYILTACESDFYPNTTTYNELLVVDGTITNDKGPYIITLSKSTQITQFNSLQPYSNCKVEISDNVGTIEQLKEVGDGIYKTDSLNGIQGVIGRKYKIKIATPEGNMYESLEEEIKKPVGIRAIYPEVQHRNDQKLPHGRDGYQFYVDTEIPQTEKNYYLWTLDKTYKFRTDFPIHRYYDSDLIIKRFYPFTPDSLSICYKEEKIIDFFILGPINKNKTQTTRIPLNYEDNYTKALTIRYSLNIKQYTITEAAYTYWNAIKKMSEKKNGLPTQQPYQEKSNIINLSSSGKPALGFFMAAGIVVKRIFAEPLFITYYYPVCVSKGDTPKLPTTSPKWPIFLWHFEYFSDRGCLDCTVNGFIKKPAYWID